MKKIPMSGPGSNTAKETRKLGKDVWIPAVPDFLVSSEAQRALSY